MTKPSAAIARILEFLKAALKERDLTYGDVAKRLDVSEATVKRLLNSANVTLGELEALASLCGHDLHGLMAAVAAPSLHKIRLTLEQETALARQPQAATYFFRLWGGDTPKEIEKATGISHASTRRYLRYLEELGMIEVHPGDKVKTPPPGRVLFIPNGPLNALFFPRRLRNLTRRMEGRGQPNVFAHPTEQGWMGRYASMALNAAQYAALLTELDELAQRYDALANRTGADPVARTDREMVTLGLFVDRFDLFDGVFPEIGEFDG